MATLTSISKVGVRFLLTALFLFAGANKVTELSFFPGFNQELAKKFLCYGSWTGRPDIWQLAVGGMEIFFAILLWLQPGIGSLALLTIMVGAIGSHVICADGGETGVALPVALLVLHLLLMRATRKPEPKRKKVQ